MPMNPGTEDAAAGMSNAIYTEIDRLLSPPLQAAADELSGDAKAAALQALDEARAGWRKLAFAIAKGTIDHLKANMEVFGVQTRGDVSASASSATGPSPPGPHTHSVSLTATQAGVTFRQSNDGTGHVR
jgi:hypothetical protein